MVVYLDGEKILRAAGLNKYESAAYLALIKNGVLNAKDLSRKGNVPMGKIYEVLSFLEDKGFIEIQKGRPAIYRPVKPKIAFEKYYQMKRREKEEDLTRLKESISVATNNLPDIAEPPGRDKVFVSTVMGRGEITKGYSSSFEEADESIYVLNSVRMMEIRRWAYHETVAPLIDVLFQRACKGIKVYCIDPGTGAKEIFEEKISGISKDDEREMVANNIMVKIEDSEFDFVLVDDTMSIIDVADPIEGTMMAIMRIYDSDFNQRLKEKFMDIWNR